jgi:ribosomal protein L11 methyltransferase
LSLVAALSGAGRTLGIDIDNTALVAARTNTALNHLERICAYSNRAIESLDERFDLVVANLEPRDQVELLELIAARVRHRGTLILTGFLVEQAAIIAQPLPSLGFISIAQQDEGGYALLQWDARYPNPREVG